jgi:hypothetical protein
MEEKEFQDFLNSLLDKLQKEDNYTLSSAEQEKLMRAANYLKKGGKFGMASAEEISNIFNIAVQGASNKESFLDRLERRQKRGELAEELSAGFNVIKDLAGLGASMGQIRQSNRTLRGLRRPGLPTPPTEDPELQNAIYNAQQGTMNAARQVQPMVEGLNQQYAQDLGLARDISGGQASTYGALGQLASLRRSRGLAETAPLVDNIRAREQARLDNLLARRQGFRQQDFQNRLGLGELALNQYNQDIGAAGIQGQIGREHLFNTMGNLADDLSVLGANYYYNNRFTGNKDIDNYTSKVDSNLAQLNKPYTRLPGKARNIYGLDLPL